METNLKIDEAVDCINPRCDKKVAPFETTGEIGDGTIESQFECPTCESDWVLAWELDEVEDGVAKYGGPRAIVRHERRAAS